MSWFTENSLSWIKRMGIKVLKVGPIPKHVAFIMDGNRRFAEKYNLERNTGHWRGYNELVETFEWCRELGILEVTVYTFSIENFKRSPEEVEGLMELARIKFQYILDDKERFKERGIRVRFFGKLSLLSVDLQHIMIEAMRVTQNNTRFTWNMAFPYTGREEITQAVSAIVTGVSSGALAHEDVSEELISNCLYTNPSSHPDLLIRTSGEVRLSDFLVWQTSYSCLYFTETLWPEFGLWNMLDAILHYQRSYTQLASLKKEHDFTCISQRTASFIDSVIDSRHHVLID